MLRNPERHRGRSLRFDAFLLYIKIHVRCSNCASTLASLTEGGGNWRISIRQLTEGVIRTTTPCVYTMGGRGDPPLQFEACLLSVIKRVFLSPEGVCHTDRIDIPHSGHKRRSIPTVRSIFASYQNSCTLFQLRKHPCLPRGGRWQLADFNPAIDGGSLYCTTP